MNLEAVLLTGGASRRMGVDKAALLVEGEPLALRIGSRLAARAERVTVLGRERLQGFDFLADETEYVGPMRALARFVPSAELVFIASCDLVCFQTEIVDELFDQLGESQAAIPVLAERAQPLCALYRASAFDVLRQLADSGETRMMGWLSAIDARQVPTEALPHGSSCTNVNTRAELESLTKRNTEI